MSIAKTLTAVVLAVALIAGTASAQPADSQDELIAAQETLIAEQRELIDSQEALLSAYRCMFDVDVELVPDGCGATFTDVEQADGVLLCPGWVAQRAGAQSIVQAWQFLRTGIIANSIALDDGVVDRLVNFLGGYREQLTALLPALSSERFRTLLGQAADSIDAVAGAAQERATGELLEALNTGLAVFDEVQRLFSTLCADSLQ